MKGESGKGIMVTLPLSGKDAVRPALRVLRCGTDAPEELGRANPQQEGLLSDPERFARPAARLCGPPIGAYRSFWQPSDPDADRDRAR